MLTAEEQYAANLALLARNPNTAGMIPQLMQFPLTNMQLLPTPTGQMFGQTWEVKLQTYVPLADPNDPRAQAIRDVDGLYTRDTKVFCLLGLGLGYFAVEFARRLEPWQRLCVWDLDPGMYKAMMYCTDIAPLFSDKRVDVIVGNDIMGQVENWWMRLDSGDKLHIVPPMRAGYTQFVMKEQYDALLEKTIEMLRYHMVGMATWRMFGKEIGNNDMLNAPEYFTSPGFEHLKDIWKDQPAVCIAAGPSLQKNLRYLLPKENREKVAIVTAGTVYALLHGLGLEPDIVTTIDFQRRNWTEQFRFVPLDPDCPLVYLHSTYPQTPRRWPGPRFVAENSSDTTGWLRGFCEGKKSAAQVQTVAHLNLMVAIEMGANPILLLGQDLSMPVDTHHAAGARAEDQSPMECAPEAFIETSDFAGKPVHTRHSFLSMKTVFERIIAEHPDRTFYNCSEAGLALSGAKNMSLKEALALADTTCQGGDSRLPQPQLRQHIKKVWRGYTPQVKPEFPEALSNLCAGVDALGRAAITIMAHWRASLGAPKALSDAQRAAVLAEEVDHPADVAEQLFAERWYQPILEQERVIQVHPMAFGLFAIRHFGIIELHGEIPPRPEEVSTPAMRMRFNAERLYRVACMIDEETNDIRCNLRETQRRMTSSGEPVSSLIMRQLYDKAVSALAWVDFTGDEHIRDLARIYEHTQQYESALNLYASRSLAHAHQARIRKHLAQWRADVRAAMPAYFGTLGEVKTAPTTVESQFEWCID